MLFDGSTLRSPFTGFLTTVSLFSSHLLYLFPFLPSFSSISHFPTFHFSPISSPLMQLAVWKALSSGPQATPTSRDAFWRIWRSAFHAMKHTDKPLITEKNSNPTKTLQDYSCFYKIHTFELSRLSLFTITVILPRFLSCCVIFGYRRDCASRPWKSA